MSTPLRDESPGYHHVVARGNNKRPIYVDDHDRVVFCLTVQRVARKYGWTVLAYCLMENHYHLLLTVGNKGLAAGMCELNTGYARTFNATHGRINHLFGRRYWSRRVTSDASLLNVIRYIVQNPRRAGGSKPLDGYRWTSYAATIGLALADIQLARDELLALFGRTPESAVDRFRAFCSATVLASPVRWQPP
ncbi:MAG TPA: transposase [Gaiellaceae bacterium]|jgi:REP element-mobilizing transposase RayT